jgi:hypothetical protein
MAYPDNPEAASSYSFQIYDSTVPIGGGTAVSKIAETKHER